LATLTQMLMLQNGDLTREVLIFIEKHLNNHFAFFKLKNSGMIEFLILCLSTRNGDRALSLLQKFQEVCIEFNGNLKFGLFNSNDLKMIQEDKNKAFNHPHEDFVDRIPDHEPLRIGAVPAQKVNLFDDIYYQNKSQGKRLPLLLESIFLRYLPVPFVKFLYEQGQRKFLEIYRTPKYDSPILIWNSLLRKQLEDKITSHATDFLEELKKYAQDPELIKHPSKLPVYDKEVSEIIKYDKIESEVRCGRYYLSKWVD